MAQSSSYLQELDEKGFVIIQGLVPDDIRQPLLDACDRVISKTRACEWPHRRKVGKQFPPFDGEERDSWGVQHLMHPDLGEPVFAEWYGSAPVRQVCQQLLGCDSEDLQMELFNLLINPQIHDFSLRWHRDDVPTTFDREDEKQRMAIKSYGVQWNTALLEDGSLWVVPGTHKALLKKNQIEEALIPVPDLTRMEGAMQVHLKPGETVFYNNNILHCATYSNKRPRITLHACMGDARGGGTRARNIFQHDLRWMKSDQMWEVMGKVDAQDTVATKSGSGEGGTRTKMLQKLFEMLSSTGGDGGPDQLKFSLEE